MPPNCLRASLGAMEVRGGVLVPAAAEEDDDDDGDDNDDRDDNDGESDSESEDNAPECNRVVVVDISPSIVSSSCVL